MSSRLKTRLDCIEHMARLSGKDWRDFTTFISWQRRKQELTEDDVPKKLEAITEEILDPDQWADIRREVAKLRRAIYRQRTKEERTTRIERRRNYMRNYMANYRRTL